MKSKYYFKNTFVRFFFLFLFLILAPFYPEFASAQATGQAGNLKKVAILPTDIRIEAALYQHLDSVALQEIRRIEGVRNQQLTYYQLAIKNKPFKVSYQNITETNRLLETSGITYAVLPYLPVSELIKVLGVDLLLTGIQHREPNSFSPEARAAFNAAANVLLGPLSTGVQNTGNPEVSFHYKLHSSAGQKLWEHRGKFELSSNDFQGENFLANNYTTSFRTYLRKKDALK